MSSRRPRPAPIGQVPAARQGTVVGRFCHSCGAVYPLHRERHSGDPVAGRDHIASPCAWEGRAFGRKADWWEPAVEVLPAAVVGETAS